MSQAVMTPRGGRGGGCLTVLVWRGNRRGGAGTIRTLRLTHQPTSIITNTFHKKCVFLILLSSKFETYTNIS